MVYNYDVLIGMIFNKYYDDDKVWNVWGFFLMMIFKYENLIYNNWLEKKLLCYWIIIFYNF